MSIVKISVGQKALEDAFSEDDWKVRHSTIVCKIHKCTDGNRLLCTDGKVRQFKRYIDTVRKVVYWCFSDYYLETL